MIRSLIICFFVFVSSSVIAQQAKFFARVDAKEVIAGSFIGVDFVLENAQGSGFTPPDFNGFTVSSGLSQGTSMSNINGRVSRSSTYSYELTVGEAGSYTIRPASIKVAGKIHKTRPISIKVLEKKKGKDSEGEDMFMRVVLSDSLAYTGQQVIAECQLFTKLDVRSGNYLNKPEYEGFFVQDIRNVRASSQRVIYEGEEYVLKSLDRVALFPQQTGTYDIGPFNFKVGVASKNRNNRGFFFGTQLKYYNIKTDSKKLTVNNLAASAPASFSGAVGKYQMYAKVAQRSITLDDAFTVEMEIVGNGDGRTVNPPAQEYNTSLDVYDPNIKSDESYESRGQWINKKTFEYLIVPKKEGRYRIVPEFTYFDVDSNDFVTLQSSVLNLAVAAGSGTTLRKTGDQKISKEELKPLAVVNSVGNLDRHFFNSIFYWLLFSLGLGAIGFLYFKNWKLIQESKIDPLTKKRNAANTVADKRLSLAAEFIEKGENKEAYAEISNTIKKYISDKYSQDYSELNVDRISQILESKSVDAENVSSLRSIMSACQMSIYAGASDISVKENFEKTKQLIFSLESFHSASE